MPNTQNTDTELRETANNNLSRCDCCGEAFKDPTLRHQYCQDCSWPNVCNHKKQNNLIPDEEIEREKQANREVQKLYENGTIR